MLWPMIKYLWKHWKFCRSLSFHITGSTLTSRPGQDFLWVHCDKCNSTGGFHMRRPRQTHTPSRKVGT